MTEIIKVVDNIITEHSFVNRELRDGEIEVNNWNGNVGDSINPKPVKAAVKIIEEEPQEEIIEEEPQEEIKEEPIKVVAYKETKSELIPLSRTDEIMILLQEIDLSSIRPIRAIISGESTESEEDYKTLKALEKQAKLLREELNVCQEK